MTDGAKAVTQLAFTKLVVENLDKVAAFYSAICGLIEQGRADDQIAGRPIRELYFRTDPPGTGTFTLTKFLDVQKPATESVILGFIAEDIDQFVDNAVAAGGVAIVVPHPRPEHGVHAAFVKDVEGNLIEVVQLI